MAYNFCAVQRKSDGKYLQINGTFATLDFTSNYSNARFYFGDNDDVSNFLGSYGSGDFRVIEYWMPGDSSSNKPLSNETVLNNFLGSPGGANVVKINTWDRNDAFTIDRRDAASLIFNSEAQQALNNRQVVVLGLNGSQYEAAGRPDYLPSDEFKGLQGSESLPADLLYMQIMSYSSRGDQYFAWTGILGNLSGESIQYFILG